MPLPLAAVFDLRDRFTGLKKSKRTDVGIARDAGAPRTIPGSAPLAAGQGAGPNASATPRTQRRGNSFETRFFLKNRVSGLRRRHPQKGSSMSVTETRFLGRKRVSRQLRSIVGSSLSLADPRGEPAWVRLITRRRCRCGLVVPRGRDLLAGAGRVFQGYP